MLLLIGDQAISDSSESVLVEPTVTMTSPTPSCDTIGSTASNSSEAESEGNVNTKCSQCSETYSMPKVLDCFHSFCQPCLEKVSHPSDKISCPDCGHETVLPSTGVPGLLPDFAVTNMLEATAVDSNMLTCTGCKSKDTKAVARCFDCANFLCPNCVMAHQFMHCFEGHRVLSLTDGQATKEEVRLEKPVSCNKHKNEYLKFYCRTCNVPICQECTMVEHAQGHEYETLNMISGPQIEALQQLADQAKVKASDLRGCAKGIEHSSNKLQIEFQKAQNEVNETYNFYRSQLEERKAEALKELDVAYTAKQNHLSGVAQKIQDAIERLYQGCEFVEKLIKHACSSEILMYSKTLNTKMQNIMNFSPNINTQNAYHVEFVSNYQAIQVGIRNTFGYVRQSPDMGQKGNGTRQNGFSPRSSIINGLNGTTTNMTNGFEPNLLIPKPQYASTNSLSSITASDTGMSSMSNMYEKWSNGGLDIMQNGTDVFSTAADPMVDLTSKLITANIYPPKSQLKRQKMIYHCKFGEFGVMEGQFTEPSGVAVNANGDIIVADTNNHRIQIFDKEGRFKFQFGECGKRDGQLLYPNRVAVVKTSGDIVVTERSPTHQVQIFNQYGQFVRKFGANILQHPRGVTVDNKGRIIIVECKVMRVIIFDQLGNMLQKFSCSKHLEFPNGVVVNDKEEIFISDNRAHCVKVFDYQGVFLRQIGGEGITNYPIGVGINSAGEILVADNHNNFNLTVFMQDGQLITALESKVKHAQCFDVALVDDGSVVLASKDYRLYIYRYMQVAGYSF